MAALIRNGMDEVRCGYFVGITRQNIHDLHSNRSIGLGLYKYLALREGRRHGINTDQPGIPEPVCS